MNNKPPRAHTAGTTLAFRRTATAYPASAGWAYTLTMRVPGYEPTAATADGDAFVFTVSAADCAAWPPGTYAYSERVTRGDDVREIGSGSITVRPNLAVPQVGSDGRTHSERTLAMLEAAIEGRVVDGIENYSIAGRAVAKIALPELFRLRGQYRLQVALERGGGRLGSVQVTFGGAA